MPSWTPFRIVNSGPVACTTLALSVVGFFVATPLDTEPTDTFAWLFYLLQACSLVLSGISFGVDEIAPPPIAEAFGNLTLPSVSCIYGAIMTPYSLAMGLQYPSSFGGLSMFANIFGSFPYLGKQCATNPAFKLPNPLQRAIPTVIDALGDTTSAILNIVNNIDG
jgi:hypothetical protein